jgi:hypothetical protein
MATLLRNSLLGQSDTVNYTGSDDLSKAIPPPLPFLPQTQPTQIPTTSYAIPKAPAPATFGEYNKLYKDLQSDAGRDLVGNDPFLQKNAIDKINQFLQRYPSTQANPDYNEDAVKPWTDLTVKTIYNKTIRTLIDVINDISDAISQSEIDGSVATRRKVVDAFFKKDRRVYVGILFIFLSFVLYFIDSAA